MVAQQKLREVSDAELQNGSSKPLNAGENVLSKSRLAILKRGSTKSKATPVAQNDPFRFQGVGLDFKGKLIGKHDVTEPRGDVMCSEAMQSVKASVKSSGAHKQRIILNISIEGLKLKDEKSGATLECFPVSRISFIARDTADARAFGFIYGTAEGHYRYYGIKTTQTADHAVLSIRDMFQVVFEMKKKQLLEAKQKQEERENITNFHREQNGTAIDTEACPVADLLDLETELENIEAGFHQLQNIPRMPEDDWFSASNPQWPADSQLTNGQASINGLSSDNPFGDSFNPAVNMTNGSSAPPQPVVNGHGNSTNWPPSGSSISPVNGSLIGNADTFMSTNPFALCLQPSPQHTASNGFKHHATNQTNGARDPFDTQPAHRIINAIDSSHSYGLPTQNSAPHLGRPVPTPPPLPIAAPVVSTLALASSTQPRLNGGHEVAVWDETFNGNGLTNGMNGVNGVNGTAALCNGHKVATVQNGTSKTCFGDDFFPFESESNGQECVKPVTTLEEAFTKLVDMDQLVSHERSSPLEGSVRKNPFEHIIRPPKPSMNALNASPTFAQNLASTSPPSANGFHGVMPSVPAVKANGKPVVSNRMEHDPFTDPFNDDFFK